jgi:predicted RNA binding protein YcfA (HicA-like mRNA interferase family)
MTRLPRDLSGSDLAQALRAFGYVVSRQSGSHLRLTTQTNGEHHVTIPAHQQLRVGTLAAILDEVASHVGIARNRLIERLFG